MNVLYELSIPAEPERVDRVRSSIEQCLDAAAIDASSHAEIARAATTLLALAGGWTASDASARIAVRIEAHDGACAIQIDATRADGRSFTTTAKIAI